VKVPHGDDLTAIASLDNLLLISLCFSVLFCWQILIRQPITSHASHRTDSTGPFVGEPAHLLFLVVADPFVTGWMGEKPFAGDRLHCMAQFYLLGGGGGGAGRGLFVAIISADVIKYHGKILRWASPLVAIPKGINLMLF